MLKRSILGRYLTVAMAFTLAMAFSAPVWAHSLAYVGARVNLYAGPQAGYPVVEVLPPGATVGVYGCLDDYSWCDVSFGGYRGWVYSNYLDEYYGNRWVPIAQYGPAIGIGIVTFGLFNYWSAHYAHRPWYHDRDDYNHRFGRNGERGRPPGRAYYGHPRSNYGPPPPRHDRHRGGADYYGRAAHGEDSRGHMRPSHDAHRPGPGNFHRGPYGPASPRRYDRYDHHYNDDHRNRHGDRH